MTDGGRRPAPGAEKSLSDLLGEVSRTSSLLVRQEIELAKAELTVKAKRLGGGAAAAAIAGVFAVLALIFFLHGLAWFFADLIGGTGLLQIWLGFLITAGVLLVLGAVSGLLALRYFRRGLPPTPQLAIDEAKKTRATIEEVSAR